MAQALRNTIANPRALASISHDLLYRIGRARIDRRF